MLFSRNFAYAKFHENKTIAKISEFTVFYHKILPGKLSNDENPVEYAIIQYVPIKKLQPNTSLTLALKDAISKMLKSFRHHLTKSIL